METAADSRRSCKRGRVARRVLHGLGINVEADVHSYRVAYERVLPLAASGGLYSVLPNFDGDQAELQWLAKHIVIRRPASGDTWWARVWSEAVDAAGISEPEALSAQARQTLVQRLADWREDHTLSETLALAMADDADSSDVYPEDSPLRSSP